MKYGKKYETHYSKQTDLICNTSLKNRAILNIIIGV